MWKYAGRDRWKLVTLYFLHLLSICGELLQPYAFGMVINSLQTYGLHDPIKTIKWIGLYVGGFFIFQVFHHSGRWFEFNTALKNQQRLVDDVYDKLCTLPLKWHAEHHSGEVVNRVRVAGEALRDFGLSQSNYMENIILTIGPVIILATVDIRIAIISVTLLSINLFVVLKMNKAIESILGRLNENFHVFSARIADFVGNVKTIINLGLGRKTGRDLHRKYDDYYLEFMNEFRINQPRCFIIAFGGIFTEIIIIIFYLWSCRNSGGQIATGNLVMIVNYFRQLRDSFFEITSNFYATIHQVAAIKSVEPISLAAEQNYSEKHIEKYKEVFEKDEEGRFNWKSVSVKGLDFKYEDKNSALCNVNLDMVAHEKIAVVGSSGAGKSTFLNMLAGLYKPDNVQLILDGKGYNDIKVIQDMSLFVPQDSEIFNNTIGWNINFGLDADEEKIRRVIKLACLDEVVARMPKGLETDIREKGINLSGGEKQRLALARGLYFVQDKSIMLLDEITSSVDPVNERAIMQNIFNNYKDRCIICSVHRLHLLDMFDKILVMHNGTIVQQGNFSDLTTREGHFKTLWQKYVTQRNTV
jgi:ABC-type multidrug transport system fused ATPase/permease subunit